MPRSSDSDATGAVLRDANLRVTAVRTALLELLAKEHKPRTVEYFVRKIGAAFDTVTVYRTLGTFLAAGIVERVGLGHDHAHYELAIGRPRHHHAVCRTCGRVEDVPVLKTALPKVPGFSRIDSQTVEYYGTCASCA